MVEKKLRVIVFINNDISSHIIFSGIFSDPIFEVRALCVTTSISTGKNGSGLGAINLLKKCALKYWFFLAFTNGVFRIVQTLTRIFNLQSEKRTIPDLVSVANRQGVPVYYSSNFSDKKWVDLFSNEKPDYFLLRINQIFSKSMLSVPKVCSICVHSSLLPSYKGIAAEFHSMKNCEVSMGSSLFEVTPKLDKGPVLSQVKLSINYDEDLFSNIIRNNLHGKELLRNYLVCEPIPKLEVNIKSSYFSWPKSEDVKIFHKKGHRLIFLNSLKWLLK